MARREDRSFSGSFLGLFCPWARARLLKSVSWRHACNSRGSFFSSCGPVASNFSTEMTLLGTIFGMPMFAYFFLRSKRAHANGNVSWKGRNYYQRRIDQQMSRLQTQLPVDRRTHLMKMSTMLILRTLPLATRACCSPGLCRRRSRAVSFPTPHRARPTPRPLKLGDSRDRAVELFPKQGIDQEWEDPCGTTLDWVDSSNPNGRGDVIIRLKKGKVFQIESSSTRFQTAEGITTFDSPEKGRAITTKTCAPVFCSLLQPRSLGDRPLVFWVDKKKGIAFALALRPVAAQALYLQDDRLRTQQGFLSRGGNHELVQVAGDPPHTRSNLRQI